MLLATLRAKPAVALRVLSVLLWRSPAEVAHSVIGWVSVQMPTFTAGRTWADKCLEDQVMNLDRARPAGRNAKVDSKIPLPINGRRQGTPLAPEEGTPACQKACFLLVSPAGRDGSDIAHAVARETVNVAEFNPLLFWKRRRNVVQELVHRLPRFRLPV